MKLNPKPPKSWCLIGIPDHQGVMNVGGRLGAALGPAAFRRAFFRFNGNEGVHSTLSATHDVGELGSNVEKNHRQAADVIRNLHQRYSRSIVVGGGHDHGYSQLLGISEAFPKARLGCINLDAHLDVRKPSPLISSGSPFYLAIESGVLDPKRLVEFGIQTHCNGPELWNYVEKKKVKTVAMKDLRGGNAVKAFRSSLKALLSQSDIAVISLDLDAAASAFAPGVSAPQAEGLSASEIIEMMEIAGNERKVISLGIFELNPLHDLDDRTAKLGATAAYHFIASGMNRIRY